MIQIPCALLPDLWRYCGNFRYLTISLREHTKKKPAASDRDLLIFDSQPTGKLRPLFSLVPRLTFFSSHTNSETLSNCPQLLRNHGGASTGTRTTHHHEVIPRLTRVLQFENSNEVGVFANLTNSYCLVAIGASENFYSIFESELADLVPIARCTVAGTRIVGRLTAGNKNGLLVPTSTTDQELQHLRNTLPDKVAVERIEERLSALGNVVCCSGFEN